MEYKEFAISVAREAGEIIRQNFTLGMEKEWKEDQSPVTKADLEINQLVVDQIKKYFPDHNIKGEEQSYLENKSKFLWVCDPVDGTIPFSHGVPICGFSLALVHEGQPILGVIYDPFSDRMFFAEEGQGAYLGKMRIQVSNASSLGKESLVDIIVWFEAKFNIWKLPQAVAHAGAKHTSLGSAVYAGGLIACGEYVGMVFPGITCHDIAAVKIIVEEAGGKVTDIFGNEQRYDQNIKGAIISNGKVHDLLVKLVKESLEKDEKS